MAESGQILIVGAGPAGLVLALTLRQNGVPVRLIDKEPKFMQGQRGSGIMPRTLEVYNYLGVLPDILKSGSARFPIRSYELPGGRKPLEDIHMTAYADPTPAFPYVNPVTLGQEYYMRILRSHLARYDCEVELSTTLCGLQQHEGHVVATVVHKDQDGQETMENVEAEFVVGTDGGKSVVRKLLGLTFDGETREGEVFISADVRLRGLSRDCWHKWGEPSSQMLLINPRTGGKEDEFWLMGGGASVDYHKLVSDPEAMRAWIKETTNRPDIEILEFFRLAVPTINVRMVNEFSKGRVFVAGDAAHVHSPTGGQGMNSSIMDAFNLAWKLSLVYKGVSPLALLSTYSEERHAVIKAMLRKSTELLDKTIANQSGAKGDSPWLRPRVLYQLGVHYRGSSIVVDENVTGNGADETATVVAADGYGAEASARVHAGDRAPDAPGLIDLRNTGDSTTTLFRLFKPTHHTVLIFVSSVSAADSTLKALNSYPDGHIKSAVILSNYFAIPADDLELEFCPSVKADLLLKDSDGHAYKNYAVDLSGKSCVVVAVRPDGAIGAIVGDVKGVDKYFKKIFL